MSAAASTPDASIPFALLAASEPPPAAGTARTRALELRWDEHGIEVHDREAATSWSVHPGSRIALQLSRSQRIVEPGWLLRALGRDTRTEHRIHLELRDLADTKRLRLSAVIDEPARLEGLPVLELLGVELPTADIEGLLCTALALGARVVAAAPTDHAENDDDVHTTASPTPALEASLILLRSERDALRSQLEEQRQRIKRLERERSEQQRTIENAAAAVLEARRRDSDTERELRKLLEEAERKLAILTASPPDARMKTLDAHNREVLPDTSHFTKLGVRCPACNDRGDLVEMIAWSTIMTVGVTPRRRRRRQRAWRRGAAQRPPAALLLALRGLPAVRLRG